MVSTYLDPLDAMLGSKSLSKDEFYFPVDFRQVDTRCFLQENGGWLDVAICYAFAANGGRVLVNETGYPVSLFAAQRFHLGHVIEGAFVLEFSERTIDMIDAIYQRAGVGDCRCQKNRNRGHELSREQFANMEDVALEAVGETAGVVRVDDAPITQCAIFDQETLEWVFVDFPSSSGGEGWM